MNPNDPNLMRDAMLGRMNASTLRPHSGSPRHETLAAHGRANVEADGAETWPEGLVEAVARAVAGSAFDRKGGSALNRRGYIERTWRIYADDATAALSAIRAWEGREA
jgi:hypothetical protein